MKCLELFAGAGGAALGLEAAGMEHAALCEWDADACATLRAAGLGPVVEGDVQDLDAIQAVVGPSVDCLWSSFPCQAFSIAGKRLGAMDERNGWPWTVAALDRFRPRWFLGENVRGLIQHSTEGHPDPMACAGCYFEGVILPQLRERFAHVGWWMLNAAHYGVPQHRRRVILWAGPEPLKAPEQTHGSPAQSRQGALFGPGLKPWVSMGEALNIRPPSFCASTGNHENGRRVHTVTGPSPTIGCTIFNHHPWTKAGAPFVVAAGVTGAGAPRPMSEAAPTIGAKGTAYLVQPSPTVTGADGQGLGSNDSRNIMEAATGRRRLTIDECARLQDFPLDHPWQGNKTARYRQIGNAVPPTLARVVAERVLEAERATLGVPAPRTHWDREGRGHGTDPNPDASGGSARTWFHD